MQVTETHSEGLKREFTVVVPAADLESAVDSRLQEISQTVEMKGFRPGKVPMSIVRQKYRPSILGEVLEQTIQESARKAIEEKSLRPAMQPKIEIKDFADDKDLEFTMDVELMPEFEIGDLSELKLTRMTAEITDQTIEDAMARIAEAEKRFEKVEEDRGAVSGDALLIDFVGEIDGVTSDGATGNDFELELGSNSFIPGFEEQLIGSKAGDKKEVKLNFPEDYPHPDSAGKEAKFDVTIKELRARAESAIDDLMAQRHGFDDLPGMKDGVRERLVHEFDQAARARLKRNMLDALAERHSFDVPPGMIEQEFEQIWQQVKADVERSGQSFEEATGDTEEDAEKEYREIAARRVRLGLVLAEIGRQNNMSVTQQDLVNAAMESASQLPNPEQVAEFYRANPQALERFQAPVFEDKVVAFVTELATVTDKTVSQDELFSDPDDDGAGAGGGKKPAKKKSATKKKPAAKADGDAKKAAPKKKAAAPRKKAATKAVDSDKPAAAKKTAKKKSTKE